MSVLIEQLLARDRLKEDQAIVATDPEKDSMGVLSWS